MKRKTILYSFIAVVVIIIGVVFFALKEYNRKQKDVADISAAYNMSSNEIITAFTADEKAANIKFLDKVVAINGTIKSNDKDEQGAYTVVLGDSSSMSSVRCSMDSAHNNEAADLKAGSPVTVKGICTGFNADELLGSDVLLKSCTIKK
jgi:predicted lactoylglutathione lyase